MWGWGGEVGGGWEGGWEDELVFSRSHVSRSMFTVQATFTPNAGDMTFSLVFLSVKQSSLLLPVLLLPVLYCYQYYCYQHCTRFVR